MLASNQFVETLWQKQETIIHETKNGPKCLSYVWLRKKNRSRYTSTKKKRAGTKKQNATKPTHSTLHLQVSALGLYQFCLFPWVIQSTQDGHTKQHHKYQHHIFPI